MDMLTESYNEARYLELYVYNTNRKISWESETSTGTDAGPDSLLEAFMDVLRKCEKSKRHVTTAVCTRQSGLVYVSSEDDDWEKAAPAAPYPSTNSRDAGINVASDQHGCSLDLNIYNIGGSTIYDSTIPNEGPDTHFHLLRRFLSVLEYSRTNTQLMVRNAAYTDGGASINISGVDAEWLIGLDLVLKSVA